MKAAICNKYGPPNVMFVGEAVTPTPKDNEILVRVYASTVNRTDTGFRSALYGISRLFSGFFKPRYINFGNEFAGKVVEVGANVTEFKVGDRVFGYDDTKFECLAEYKTIAQDGMVAHIPKKLSYEQAAPILEGSHYALHYIRAAKIGTGTSVLVYGSSGGIGSAAVQLMKHVGAEVTAVCDTRGLLLTKKLQPDYIINRDTVDFVQQDTKYDVIFDAVGKDSFRNSRKALKPTGIYMSTELGDKFQNPFLAIRSKLWGKQKVLFPIPRNRREDVLYIKDLVEKAVFMPVIDVVYSLDEIVEAHTYVESAQKLGNVVISIK